MNPQRHSQIERALSILDKSGVVEILKDDQYLLFLFKKTERVVAALYIVTGLFPDAEPLKWGIRESGTSLLTHLLSFKERAMAHSKEFISDTLAEIAHLFSLLNLAYVTDLLSPMNFSVLKKELDGVLTIAEGRGRIPSSPTSPLFFEEGFFGLSKDIFSGGREDKSSVGALSPEEGGRGAKTKENETIYAFSDFERLERNQKDIYKGHPMTTHNVLKGKTPTHTPRAKQNSVGTPSISPLPDRIKESRRQSILAVLRQQKSAMIKDFSAVIKGCSEKTIQRLLIEMVQKGVLYREGHRRWSRYSIPDDNQKKIS